MSVYLARNWTAQRSLRRPARKLSKPPAYGDGCVEFEQQAAVVVEIDVCKECGFPTGHIAPSFTAGLMADGLLISAAM